MDRNPPGLRAIRGLRGGRHVTLTEARRWGRLDRLWERFLALRPPPLDAERARDRAWRKRRKSMERDAFDGIDEPDDALLAADPPVPLPVALLDSITQRAMMETK